MPSKVGMVSIPHPLAQHSAFVFALKPRAAYDAATVCLANVYACCWTLENHGCS